MRIVLEDLELDDEHPTAKVATATTTESTDSPTIRDLMDSPLLLGDVSPNGLPEPNQT
jgi:hypothetical protein